MLVDDVAVKLAADVPTLVGRIEKAAEFARLVAENSLPQNMPAAFVIGGDLQGTGIANQGAGFIHQNLVEIVSVVLCVAAAGDATGSIGLPDIDTLKDQVMNSIIGLAVDGYNFEFNRGRLQGLAGMVVYQLDFSIRRQIRK